MTNTFDTASFRLFCYDTPAWLERVMRAFFAVVIVYAAVGVLWSLVQGEAIRFGLMEASAILFAAFAYVHGGNIFSSFVQVTDGRITATTTWWLALPLPSGPIDVLIDHVDIVEQDGDGVVVELTARTDEGPVVFKGRVLGQ